ncbi:MAG TPA: hypothetical protein VFR86_03905 [Burkholderiaceae bacterium]|nr:hypothetical protein [Burkholderiaceae bacterium]
MDYETWHVPLADGHLLLGDAYGSLRAVGLRQDQIPFIVQLIENPRFDVPGIELFPGATDLETHDYIHVLLGRGLLPKDEAFVLGFTMGSTNRMSATEERLYELFARYLYPKSYRFGEDEMQVFRDAVRLGYVSDCASLAEADYAARARQSIAAVRAELGVEEDLLRAYYAIEKRRYPTAPECQRLLG